MFCVSGSLFPLFAQQLPLLYVYGYDRWACLCPCMPAFFREKLEGLHTDTVRVKTTLPPLPAPLFVWTHFHLMQFHRFFDLPLERGDVLWLWEEVKIRFSLQCTSCKQWQNVKSFKFPTLHKIPSVPMDMIFLCVCVRAFRLLIITSGWLHEQRTDSEVWQLFA